MCPMNGAIDRIAVLAPSEGISPVFKLALLGAATKCKGILGGETTGGRAILQLRFCQPGSTC